MATLPTHALVGCALARLWPGEEKSWPVYAAAGACAMLPDADAIGFWMGVPYGDVCGHRGLTHSLAFAACAGLAGGALARRKGVGLLTALATASHGLLDSMTDGGLGVAFFAPFWNARYFLPWRPIAVSPISITHFFEHGGARVLRSELVWVWVPTLALLGIRALFSRRIR